MDVVHDGYYSLLFAPAAPNTSPATAEAKAARYDALIANAGVFTIDGMTLAQHVQQSTNPKDIGHVALYRYHLHGDTLVATATGPWQKDSTKTVRTDLTFVRLK